MKNFSYKREKISFKMFSDSDINITGFDSCPEAEKSVSDGSSQTEALKTSNEETQTARVASSGIQADPQASNFAPDSTLPAYNSERLLSFLKRIFPRLEEELKDLDGNNDNLSFDGGNMSDLGVKDQQESGQPSLEFSIQPEYCKGKVISDLTWNSTGMLLAVSCSEKSHEGWCSHETSVGVYNMGRSKGEKHSPQHILKASVCVRCIQFHPYIPSLLAGGLHSGEVVIWDLTNDETLMTNIRGSGDESNHVDAITSLTWREDRNGLWLVTTGRDGRIIFWKVTVTNLTYEAHERFFIQKQQAALKEHSEVLYISFWPHKESDFVIASGNSVLHCCLTTAKPLPSYFSYKNPVSMSYSLHESIVTCVVCSPSSDILASCGVDSRVHIYKFQTPAPLHVIRTNYPMMGVRWRNKELVSWGLSKIAECHKINWEEGAHVSTILFETDEGVSSIALNSSRQGKIAAGTIAGEILILSDDVI